MDILFRFKSTLGGDRDGLHYFYPDMKTLHLWDDILM